MYIFGLLFKNRLEISGELVWSIFGLIKFRFYYVRDQNFQVQWFLDLGPIGPRIYGFKYSKILLNILATCGNMFAFYECEHFETSFFRIVDHFSKDGHRNMMKIRLKNLGHLEYEINIYLNNMKLQFCNKSKKIRNFWDFENLKRFPFEYFETSKLQNFWNSKNLKISNTSNI